MIEQFDNFVANPDAVRQSALRAGFGTWSPNKGDIGADFYSGVAFWGDHATLCRALYGRLRRQIIPSSMFFRITNPSMEHALIHSDREYGDYTAIVYLSQGPHGTLSGTGFYRHRETGWVDCPPLQSLMQDEAFFSRFKQQMLDAKDEDWELHDFVQARYNRCVVFDAPKIHCRIPKNGYGEVDADSRMVWVCHYGFAS